MTGGLVLGAYSLFDGVADEALADAYRGLHAQPLVGGLEMPLSEALGERPCLGDPRWGLPAVVADDWDVVITCVPTVMGQLATGPGYGLASTNLDGRRAAVADVRRALDLARALADHSGRRRVLAVEVQSAPRRALASQAAFEASLAELLTIEAAGAVLAVEHCDATRPGRQPAKGFLEISEELAVIAALDDSRLGLSVNWGRSAIEGRSIQTPEEHVALAAAAGHLAGLMFSGASDVAGPWGEAWADGHVAPRGAGPGASAWSESLLGREEIRQTLVAAGGCVPQFLGVKVTAHPRSVSVRERLIVAARALELVALAADGY